MKKIVKTGLVLLVCTSLLGCSAQKVEEKSDDVMNVDTDNKGYNAYANILEESTMNLSSMAEIDVDISNANTMYEMSDYLALVRIDTIDGGSNANLTTDDYVYPYTYGKMTVLHVYKGDIQIGGQLDYIRMGGIVSFDEYLNGLYPNQREKILENMTERPEYVKQMFGEDIDIEVGTNYLVYLSDSETQDARPGFYPIIGWEGGLRAVSGDVSGNLRTKSDIKVYNNITEQWETLENVVPNE